MIIQFVSLKCFTVFKSYIYKKSCFNLGLLWYEAKETFKTPRKDLYLLELSSISILYRLDKGKGNCICTTFYESL